MRLVNNSRRWGAIAQTFHWLIAALIVVQFTLALLAENAGAMKRENPAAVIEQLALLARHKSVGITILMLAILRLSWRAVSAVPQLPHRTPRWQVRLAHASHTLMYVLLFALPITGWMMSSATNYPVSWFGLATLPDLVSPNHDLHETLETVHHFLAWSLFSIAVVHIAAALEHHFIARDEVLKRMLPWTK
jgi:cytochrome b561